MPVTTSTDGYSLVVLVGNVINQFNLGLKLVGITIDGGTNLATCKAILESNFEKVGLFDLEKPMFVMECLAHVLDDDCKAVVMDVKYDGGRVNIEVTRMNMQGCIAWTKRSQNGAKSLETVQKHVVLPCREIIKPVRTRFASLIHSFYYLTSTNSMA